MSSETRQRLFKNVNQSLKIALSDSQGRWPGETRATWSSGIAGDKFKIPDIKPTHVIRNSLQILQANQVEFSLDKAAFDLSQTFILQYTIATFATSTNIWIHVSTKQVQFIGQFEISPFPYRFAMKKTANSIWFSSITSLFLVEVYISVKLRSNICDFFILLVTILS